MFQLLWPADVGRKSVAGSYEQCRFIDKGGNASSVLDQLHDALIALSYSWMQYKGNQAPAEILYQTKLGIRRPDLAIVSTD